MEHIKEILEKQTRINTSNKNTDTWSSAESAGAAPEKICPACQGARFVYPLMASGKPDYSRVIPCRCALETAGEEHHTRLQNYSHLGLLTRLTFATINPRGRSEDPDSQEKFTQACQAAKAFTAAPKGWFVLVGPSASGKTHLAAAIANQCIENNQPVFYVTVPDLLDHLRSTFSPASAIPYDEFFEQVRNAPLLIMDDLGVQSSTPWAREKLDQLLNHRFSNQLPTVIVSIVPIIELEERIRSRLLTPDFCRVCELGEEKPALSSYSWSPEFELQKRMTFESFDWKRSNLPPEERDNLKKAFDLARGFAEEPDGWMVLQGTNGCGKTHLAAAIANYRYKSKKPALFVVVPDFLDHLLSTFSPESKISYDRLFESVKNAPLLVLDDFGQQSTTPWAQEKLYQVINHRYNSRLPTVITTTCSMDELDSPISSRFVDPKLSLYFHILAPDYRGDANQKRPARSSQRGPSGSGRGK